MNKLMLKSLQSVATRRSGMGMLQAMVVPTQQMRMFSLMTNTMTMQNRLQMTKVSPIMSMVSMRQYSDNDGDQNEDFDNENSEELHLSGQAFGEELNDEWMTQEQIDGLKAKLEEFGPILRFINLAKRDDKPGKILAVFQNREDALKLTNTMNRSADAEADGARGTLDIVEGFTLHFNRKPSRFSRQASVNKKAVYVKNLNYQVEEWELEETFSKYGEIRNITIMKDHETGLPKGIAFVNFAEEGPAEQAVSELDGEQFRGRYMRCQLPENRNKRRQQRNNFENEDRYRY